MFNQFNVDYEVNCNLTFLARLLVSGAESPGDIHEAEVSDDCSPVLEEDVLGLQIGDGTAQIMKNIIAKEYLPK